MRCAGLVLNPPIVVPILAIALIGAFRLDLDYYFVPGPPCSFAGAVLISGHALRSVFVHADSMHLLSNVSGLILQGVLLELLHGPTRTFGIFMLSGAIGALCWHDAFENPLGAYCGASSGIYGIMGALMSHTVLNWHEMPLKWIWLICSVYVVSVDVFIAIYSPNPRIAYAAHLGGGFSGFFLGLAWLKNSRVLQYERVLTFLGCVAALSIGLSAFVGALCF